MSITVRTDEQGLEEVVLSVPGFTPSWGPTRSGSEQELEGICPDPSKSGLRRYACALSVLFICVRFGSFQFGRTKWQV